MTEDMERQIAELTAVHQELTNIGECNDEIFISGALPFEATADGLETIRECFDIEITVANDFPDTLPRVKETAGRVAADYEHRNQGGTLCLAVPIEQRRIFFEQPTLLGFVNRLVIPYLYGYCFFKKHARHPFEEAAHGYEGILRYYVDALHLRDEVTALSVICFLMEFGYRGHHDCPCGSGKKVRACHGSALLVLYRTHNQRSLRDDFIAIFGFLFTKFQAEKLSIPKPLRTQLIRLLDGLERKR